MGRHKKSDTQFHIRIDSTSLEWFREYCMESGISMSDFIRQHLAKLKRRDERTKRKAQLAQLRDKHQLRLFD